MDNRHRIEELFRSNQLEEAEALILDEIQARVEDPDLYFMLGQIHYRRQQWGKAINAFQRVLELNPAYPGAKEQIQMANAILGYFTPDMFNP